MSALPVQDATHFVVVRHEHLNHYGNLFGGYILQIIDEQAFICCARKYPGRNFVTRAMQDVEFHAPARLGDIIETTATIERVGRTSCQVRVRVHIRGKTLQSPQLCFDGVVTLVCVDEEGIPRPVST